MRGSGKELVLWLQRSLRYYIEMSPPLILTPWSQMKNAPHFQTSAYANFEFDVKKRVLLAANEICLQERQSGKQ